QEDAFLGVMSAFVSAPGPRAAHASAEGQGAGAALGAKLVTVFNGNHARGLDSHLASIVLMDPETGALAALMDGRYITEARTAAVSAVSATLLARKTAKSLAIIGSGVQARSHLEALSSVHGFSQVAVWSPNKSHRDRFVDWANSAIRSQSDRGQTASRSVSGGDQASGRSTSGIDHVRIGSVAAVDHAGEAVVGADVAGLGTAWPPPVIENGWVKPGAHVISVGACRPNQRELDPALIARARLFVDSRAAALVESGDVVLGMHEQRFGADHIVAEIGEVANGAEGRRSNTEVTIFKSLGLAVEDVTAADLAYQRAVERGIGKELTL